MKTPTMTITMVEGEGGLEADSFWQVIRCTIDALRRLDMSISHSTKPNNKWIIIDVKMSSPLSLTVIGRKAFDDAGDIDPVRPFLQGVRQIEDATDRPQYFSDAILADIKRVANLGYNGIKSITYSAPDEQAICPSQQTISHIDKIRRRSPKQYETLVELDGTLDKLDVHGVHEFYIYDQVTDNAVRCFFDEKDYKDVVGLIKRRVRVAGQAKFSPDHDPISVQVRRFRALPDEQNDTSVKEIHDLGISITSGRDSVDYIRDMRDAK